MRWDGNLNIIFSTKLTIYIRIDNTFTTPRIVGLSFVNIEMLIWII